MDTRGRSNFTGNRGYFESWNMYHVGRRYNDQSGKMLNRERKKFLKRCVRVHVSNLE